MATFEHKDIILDSDSLADACFCLRHFGYLPPEFDHDKIHENPAIVKFVETYCGHIGTESFQEWEECFDRGMSKLKLDLGITVLAYQNIGQHYISRDPGLDKSVELFANWVFENLVNDGVAPNDELVMWSEGVVQCHFPVRYYNGSHDQGQYERALAKTVRNMPVGSVWAATWGNPQCKTAWIFNGTNMCHVGSWDPRPAVSDGPLEIVLKDMDEEVYW